MISLVFAALLAGAPAADPAPAPAATTTVAAMKVEKKPGPNDVVCKKEPVLGSRMKSRTCMTQAEWDARRTQDRDDLSKAQTQIPLRGN